MNTTALKYSLLIAVLLSMLFLVTCIFPFLQEISYFFNLASFLVITVILTAAYNEYSVSVNRYGQYLLFGCAIGSFGGAMFCTFFYVYTHYIDSYYYSNLATRAMERGIALHQDEVQIDQSIEMIGMYKKYFIAEASMLISIIIKTLATSLILGAFWSSRMKKIS